MKRALTFLLAPLLPGCVPLRQEALVRGTVPPIMSLEDDKSLLVSIDLQKEKIITDGSYVLAPDGSRYALRIGPHDYDVGRRAQPTRARVYLYDAHGHRLHRWKNGVWSFHFKMEARGQTKVVNQQWKYWTFYYCPIIHGPMN